MEVDLSNIPLNDPKVFSEISKGHTVGVFQLGTYGMTSTARKVKPATFDEIAAVIALHRPISIQYVDNYVTNKRIGHFDVVSETMRSILERTYGVLVYQEQVMEITKAVAGFSMSEADEVRKIIAKTSTVQREMLKPKVKSLRKRFFAGCRNKGITETAAKRIWTDLERGTNYSFNRSHAISYAYLSYHMMYLKCHYPLQFMSALLNREIGDRDKTALYFKECFRMGLNVLPLDIRYSGVRYKVEDDAIRPPLTMIRDIGKKSLEKLTRKKKRNFPDFRTYMALKLTTDSMTDLLIKAGAFDYLGERDQSYNEFLVLKGEDLSEVFDRDSLLDVGLSRSQQVRWNEKDKMGMQRELIGVII